MWDTPWIEQKTFFLQTVARNLGLFSSLLAGRKSGPPRRLWFSPGWVVGTKPLSTAFLLLPSFFFFYICQIDIIDHGSWSEEKNRGSKERRREGRSASAAAQAVRKIRANKSRLCCEARGGREEEKKEEGKKSFFTSSENLQGSYERLWVFLVGLPTFYRYS